VHKAKKRGGGEEKIHLQKNQKGSSHIPRLGGGAAPSLGFINDKIGREQLSYVQLLPFMYILAITLALLTLSA
jgi:hypothetical protein